MLNVLTGPEWQLGGLALLAFYLAANLGANDVANSMGTSVGSKALTLRQAIIAAGILEFTGAVLFGQGVSETLATGVVNPAAFTTQPQIFLLGMVSVLLASGIWLQIATSRGLPVSSSHATVGAIAGFGTVAVGVGAVNWQTIGIISLTWLITPLVSGCVAALFYSVVKRWILDQPNAIQQMREWIPWLSTALLSIFGVIVLVPLVETPWIRVLLEQWGWHFPAHDLPLVLGGIAAVSLSLISWQQFNSSLPKTTGPNPIERQLGRFQVLSACFVAFAHGSNDVGNAVAPLAVIAYVRRTGMIPLNDFEVPFWVLGLGGIGIVAGLAIWGKTVIATIGEKIIELQPSGGFCAELATAATVLIASRLALPVSTSHALVGAVVGVGLIKEWQSVRFETLRAIGSAWVITVPAAALLSAGIFSLLHLFMG